MIYGYDVILDILVVTALRYEIIRARCPWVEIPKPPEGSNEGSLGSTVSNPKI